MHISLRAITQYVLDQLHVIATSKILSLVEQREVSEAFSDLSLRMPRLQDVEEVLEEQKWRDPDRSADLSVAVEEGDVRSVIFDL